MSPLRRSVSERVSWLQEFSQDVETCASSAGLAVAELTAGLWPPPAIEERLSLIQNKAQLTDLDNEVGRRAVQTVQALLSKCDLDLDPSFSNPTLQPAMLRLVKAARLRLIEPKHGDPFDKKLHTRVSLERHTGEELRGTVASVRARGLIDPNNIVITRAEIREYD